MYNDKEVTDPYIFSITISNTSDYAITWSTSNSKIATVSSKGKVTAIATGTAKIYAKYLGIKYTCSITVEEKTYKTGETWTVPGKFSLTFSEATMHEMCNPYDNHDGFKEAVIINYSYKNLGYNYSSSGLKIDYWDFDVYDEKGASVGINSCTHCYDPQYCRSGMKCDGAQESVMLKNESNFIYIYVTIDDENNNYTAKFKIDVNRNSGSAEKFEESSLENISAYAIVLLKGKLKNPSSFELNNIVYQEKGSCYDYDTGKSETCPVVYVWYSASNSYGGMTDGYVKAWYSEEMMTGLTSSAPYYNIEQQNGYVVVSLDVSCPSTFTGYVDIDKVDVAMSYIDTYHYTAKWLY